MTSRGPPSGWTSSDGGARANSPARGALRLSGMGIDSGNHGHFSSCAGVIRLMAIIMYIGNMMRAPTRRRIATFGSSVKP